MEYFHILLCQLKICGRLLWTTEIFCYQGKELEVSWSSSVWFSWRKSLWNCANLHCMTIGSRDTKRAERKSAELAGVSTLTSIDISAPQYHDIASTFLFLDIFKRLTVIIPEECVRNNDVLYKNIFWIYMRATHWKTNPIAHTVM